MAALKNITNGQVSLTIDQEDKINESQKLIRVPGGDYYDMMRRSSDGLSTNFFIENLRTGSFSQISEKYLKESRQAKHIQTEFTTNSFETEMLELKLSIETRLSKIISFFQGIYAGMALLFTITLNLSESVSKDLVRVEDQSIRVVSLLTTLGSLFSLIRASQRYNYIKMRGTSSEIEQKYKCFVLCAIEFVFYSASYIVYNVSHPFSVNFNIAGVNYRELSTLTTVYTVLCLLGWAITNFNTKKHQK